MYLPELSIHLDHVSNKNYNSVKAFSHDRVEALKKFLAQLKKHEIDGKSIINSSKFKEVTEKSASIREKIQPTFLLTLTKTTINLIHIYSFGTSIKRDACKQLKKKTVLAVIIVLESITCQANSNIFLSIFSI